MSSTVSPTSDQRPDPESVRLAMDEAWREHQHARDQTWTALKLTIALVAGFVAIEVRFHNHLATAFGAVLVIAEAYSGLCIAKHHRAYQRLKFRHILNCEEWLGLHRSDLICDVTEPAPITWLDTFRGSKQNSVLFIMRMQMGLIVFALIFVVGSFFL
jgi:hypothetical protein